MVSLILDTIVSFPTGFLPLLPPKQPLPSVPSDTNITCYIHFPNIGLKWTYFLGKYCSWWRGTHRHHCRVHLTTTQVYLITAWWCWSLWRETITDVMCLLGILNSLGKQGQAISLKFRHSKHWQDYRAQTTERMSLCVYKLIGYGFFFNIP